MVIIRPWKEQDIAELARVANNKKLWDNLRDRLPHPYTENDAVEWIRMQSNIHPITNFCIEVEGRVAGSIGIMPKEDIHRISAEIGYFLDEDLWGKGIATEAVKQLLDYIEEHFDFVRIFAGIFEPNKASMRVLEKNGFHLESVQKKAVIKNGIILNEYIWVKLIDR
jgi:[ribosomal protein S5]-alanine N-acetyltransferase